MMKLLPPMRYLARWRIQLAANQLRNSDLSLARMAEQVDMSPRPPSTVLSSAVSVCLPLSSARVPWLEP